MSLVFTLDIEIKTLTLLGKTVFRPSISVSIEGANPTILPLDIEDNDEQKQFFEIRKIYQIMVTVDVFKAIDSWPFTFNVSMEHDEIIVASTTYELRPLIAAALANCGQSPKKEFEAKLRTREGHKEIAALDVGLQAKYIPGNEHKKPVEIITSRQITAKQYNDSVFVPKKENSFEESGSSISSENVSIESISSESQDDFTQNSSLLQGHESFKAAGDANRSKLETTQRSMFSTVNQSAHSRRMSYTANSSAFRTGGTFTNDFIDE